MLREQRRVVSSNRLISNYRPKNCILLCSNNFKLAEVVISKDIVCFEIRFAMKIPDWIMAEQLPRTRLRFKCGFPNATRLSPSTLQVANNSDSLCYRRPSTFFFPHRQRSATYKDLFPV